MPSLRLLCGLFFLLLPGCGSGLLCGDGTAEQDGACVPADPLVCGDGTVASGGECVVADPMTCGPGTVDLDGTCTPEVSCGDTTVERDGLCESEAVAYVWLPFTAGTVVEANQGFHGGFSHDGQNTYAVDFGVEEGTPIVAARGGKVLAVKEDSNSGCGEESCAPDGNYVIIDHGDATHAAYYHLRQNGAAVEVGDEVCTGEPIGWSGNTGYSTGPHLHFEVNTLWRDSIRLHFYDLIDESDGWFPSMGTVESENQTPASCAESFSYSTCPEDAFALRGVFLDPGAPCNHAVLDQAYTISGWVVPEAEAVLLMHQPAGTTLWHEAFVEANSDGTFSTTHTWSSAQYSNQGHFIWLARIPDGNGGYDSTSWDVSPRIYLTQP